MHTKEPWKLARTKEGEDLKAFLMETFQRTNDHGNCANNYWAVLSPESTEVDQVFTALSGNGPTSEQNAKRIVSCVNACSGISNEALDAGVIGELKACLEIAHDYVVGDYITSHKFSTSDDLKKIEAVLSKLK